MATFPEVGLLSKLKQLDFLELFDIVLSLSVAFTYSVLALFAIRSKIGRYAVSGLLFAQVVGSLVVIQRFAAVGRGIPTMGFALALTTFCISYAYFCDFDSTASEITPFRGLKLIDEE